MQYLSLVTERYSLCTKLTDNILDKLSSILFSILLARARVAVMYFMVKTWWPELHQNMPCLSPMSPASAEFRKIP